jgi:hypothetical protein
MLSILNLLKIPFELRISNLRWLLNIYNNPPGGIQQVLGHMIRPDPFLGQVLLNLVAFAGFNQNGESATGVAGTLHVFDTVSHHGCGGQINSVFFLSPMKQSRSGFTALAMLCGQMGTIKDILNLAAI